MINIVVGNRSHMIVINQIFFCLFYGIKTRFNHDKQLSLQNLQLFVNTETLYRLKCINSFLEISFQHFVLALSCNSFISFWEFRKLLNAARGIILSPYF